MALKVQVSHEPTILGTAGGVAAARDWLGPTPVLIHNGDILGISPLRPLFDYPAEGLCLAIAPRAAGEGTVGLDAEGRVVRLRGEQFGVEARGGDYVGVAVLGRRCLQSLPARGCLIGDWAMPELRAGGRIDTRVAPGNFTDAGSLASYLDANLAWLEAFARDGWWLGPGARVGSRVELEQCVVGSGARVDGSGLLRRCVIWPGARAEAPLSDAVVTRGGRIVTGLGAS